jgi:hypothetical protein
METKMTRKSELEILMALEKLYDKSRPKVSPLYPVDKRTGRIELPEDVIADLKFFLLVGNKPAAVKRVAGLTGAGLRMSKDFIDSLQQ